jgi:prepilin-type N-terminal cleavage/methylation domain-containing protein
LECSPRTGLVRRAARAFTILELLVVISIIGIMAALAVPAIKNLGKSNVRLSAARQLLDDIGRARQLAISQRTTVYMIFMPTNFWDTTTYTYSGSVVPGTSAFTNLFVNLSGDQLTGYTFVTLRSVGDQPGQNNPSYLASWQTLPDNNFIAQWKFSAPYPATPSNIMDAVTPRTNTIYGFDRTTTSIPFPFVNSPTTLTNLPYIAFNYEGQLIFPPGEPARDVYIPLATGTMFAPTFPSTKVYQVGISPTVTEIPPGNSTGPGYNVIHINWLTGRARQETQQVQ